MRYYFYSGEEEFTVEISQKMSRGVVKEYLVNKRSFYTRALAGKNFGSWDQKSWFKLLKSPINKSTVSNSESFKIYRGYKPSGLFSGGAGTLVTQMPGKVVKVMVKEGDQVKEGDTILILEAMKMENEIKTSVAGEVKAFNVKEGQAIEAGFVMAEIE